MSVSDKPGIPNSVFQMSEILMKAGDVKPGSVNFGQRFLQPLVLRFLLLEFVSLKRRQVRSNSDPMPPCLQLHRVDPYSSSGPASIFFSFSLVNFSRGRVAPALSKIWQGDPGHTSVESDCESFEIPC
jgi:hypothetical protein